MGGASSGWTASGTHGDRGSIDRNRATRCPRSSNVSTLNFDDLRAANIERLPQFKNKKGAPAHSLPDGSDWTPLEWSGAAAGEVGELTNLAKKLRRGDAELDEVIDDDGTTLREAMAKECADVVVYIDLVAKQIGVNLGEAVRAKFNEVSERAGSTVRL